MSTLPTNRPSSAKRRKIDHTPEKQSSSRSEMTSTTEGRITETPIDVLYEIFSYLEPLDLLHLSWSSKALHSIVMGKSAKFIWENAFEALYINVRALILLAPPRCPPDLNLAQHTRLLFNKQCMECNSLKDTNVMWPLRLCLCRSCLDVLTTHTPTRRHTLTGDRLSPLVDRQYQGLLPCAFIPGKHRQYVRASELKEVKAMLDSLEPGSHSWAEYVEQREEWTNAIQLGEDVFSRWQKDQESHKSYKLKQVRQNTVVGKLGALGWKDELDRLNVNELQALPGVRVAKPLTDKGWKILCPRLIAHLEATKDLRLERERHNRIAERCHALSMKISSWALRQPPPEEMLPRVLDVAFSEPFKSFIFNDSDTEPTFITNEDELERMMEQFTEEWNEARVQFLLSLIPTSTGTGSEKITVKGKGKVAPSSVLNLATTIFHCPSGRMACPSGMDNTSYPRVLAHECQRPMATKRNCRDTDPEGLQILSTGLYPRPWLFHCQDLTFDQQASDAARIIVQTCGENPDEVTAGRMDEIDCRLQCTRCRGHEHERYIVNWRKAIQHEVIHFLHPSLFTSQPGEAKWHLVTDPEDLALVYAAEETATIGTPNFACKACGGWLQNNGARSDLEIMQIHWGGCARWKGYNPSWKKDLDERLFPSNPVNASVPEEKVLRTMFRIRGEWFISQLDVLIPPRKEIDKDDLKME